MVFVRAMRVLRFAALSEPKIIRCPLAPGKGKIPYFVCVCVCVHLASIWKRLLIR